MTDIDTENLYLNLYDDIADYAEYLQADWPERNFLPAVLILAALFWCLSAFSSGFLNQLGGAAANAASAKISAIVHHRPQAHGSSSKPPDQEEIIRVLEYLRPFLKMLEQSDDEQRHQQEKLLSGELQKLSIPEPEARQLAAKFIAHLREAGKPS
jgi:hypothetical protein